MELFSRYRDLVLPLGIIACLAVILVPLPPALMDMLLAANITIGVIVLLLTVHIATPLEFSIFPSLLLATTLSRLVLNVATTRMILTTADSQGMSAAGGVIQSFGEFVAGDQIEVGLIIFVILVVIQFVVITKGATRISEVAARFALDGMPGRQMAIDADVNAGLIDENEAHRRREEIRSQADFYGTMDGASKFVRGDAIAGIVITCVNIIAGLYVGVVQAGLPLAEAGNLYAKLTIGDGLVSQVPALLISLAAGLLVTRSTRPTNLPTEFLQQLFGNTRVLMIAGVFLLLLMVTNLPLIPMATLGLGCIGLSIVMKRESDRKQADEDAKLEADRAAANAPKQKRAEDYLAVDPMEVSIGLGLLGLADPARGGDLMERIAGIRNSMAGDIGIVLPKVRVRDDSELAENEFAIRISGNIVLTAELLPQKMLAIDNGQTTGRIDGLPASNMGTDQRAVWIDPNDASQASIYGYLVREPSQVLTDHLQEVCTFHADEILSRDATKHLIDQLRETSPTVVDDLIPDQLRISEVQQVLQNLLTEGIPIRQLGLILENLGDAVTQTNAPALLYEQVRRGLARTISSRFRDESGTLHVITLDSATETAIGDRIPQGDEKVLSQIAPEASELACERIQIAVKNLIAGGHPPILLVNPRIRASVRQITATKMPSLRVLSFAEITRDTQINSHEMVSVSLESIQHANAA